MQKVQITNSSGLILIKGYLLLDHRLFINLNDQQRRRSAEDEQMMRKHLKEGDLISAEVQSVFTDGSLSLHTRSLKYGKVSLLLSSPYSHTPIGKKGKYFGENL